MIHAKGRHFLFIVLFLVIAQLINAQIADFVLISDRNSNELIADIIITSSFSDAFDVANALTQRVDTDMNTILISILQNRNSRDDYQKELLLRIILHGLLARSESELREIALQNEKAIGLLAHALDGINSSAARSAILRIGTHLPDGPGSKVTLGAGEHIIQILELSDGFLSLEEVFEFHAFALSGLSYPTTEFIAQVDRIVTLSRQRNVVMEGREILENLLRVQ